MIRNVRSLFAIAMLGGTFWAAFTVACSKYAAARATRGDVYEIGGTISDIISRDTSLIAAQGARIVAYDVSGLQHQARELAVVPVGPIRDIFEGNGELYVQTTKERHRFEWQSNQLEHSCSKPVARPSSKSFYRDGYIIDNIINDGIHILEGDSLCAFPERGFIELKTNGTEMDLRGDLLAVAGSDSLWILSIADAPNIVEVGKLQGPIRNVVFYDNNTLVVSDDSAVSLVDITSISEPMVRASLDYQVTSSDIVNVVDDQIMVFEVSGEVRVLEFDGTKLSLVGSPDPLVGEPTSGITRDGEILYAGEFGIARLSRNSGQWTLTSVAKVIADSPSVMVASDGAKIIVDRSRGAFVFGAEQVTDRTPIQEFGRKDMGTVSEDDGLLAASYSEKLQSGARTYGLLIYRKNTEGQYVEVVTIGRDISLNGLLVSKNHIYVCDSNACPYIYSIDDTNLVALQGAHPITDKTPRKISLHGDLFIMSAWEAGVSLIDVSVASSPREVGAIPALSRSNDAVMTNDRLYVADEANGILVYDSVASGSPTLLATLPVDIPYDLAAYGNRLVSLGSRAVNALTFYDLKRTEASRELGVILPCRSRAVAIGSSGVLAAAEKCGAFNVEIKVEHSVFFPLVTKSH